jgi:hypothetical protein
MNAQAAAALLQLNQLADELYRRENDTNRRLAYYKGHHRLRFASDQFADYFAKRFTSFADNWCVPVVQIPAERMNVQGIRLDDTARETDDDLSRVWRANDAPRYSSEAFVVGLAAARSYALVWGSTTDEQTPRISWENPCQAVVGYDPDTRERVAALKLWRDDKREYATLFTPDLVWKWQRNLSHAKDKYIDPTDVPYRAEGFFTTTTGLYVTSVDFGDWAPRQPDNEAWPLPNPLGVVPMVELRNQTMLDDEPISDIDGTIAMQDAINLVWAYLMNALDFASLPQRIVMGADIPKVPVLDDAGQVTGYRPVDLNELLKDRILWVPGEATKIGEWSAATLAPFSDVIERAVEHIAAQTRTPPHYLIGKLANLSAEALTAAETGLVSKVGERIVYFGSSVREVFRLVALAQGDEAKAAAVAGGSVVWADAQFRSLAQKVDALVKMRQIGFPMEWIAEQYGLAPHEVDRVIQMIKDERQSDPLGLLTQQIGQQAGQPGDSAAAPID